MQTVPVPRLPLSSLPASLVSVSACTYHHYLETLTWFLEFTCLAMILSLSLSQSCNRSQSFGNAETPVETQHRQTALMVRKNTILSLTSRFDVTSLSSCLLNKKQLGLLGNTSTKFVTDFYPALQPTAHRPPPFFPIFFSCLEVSLGGGGQCNIQILPLKPPPQKLKILGEVENRMKSEQELY